MDQFTRREVNRALLTGALALAAGGPARIQAEAVTLFDFAIAGGSFHALEQVVTTLRVGQRLSVHAEPENPHDSDAVAVHLGGRARLGYVPRAANQPIARLIRSGSRVDAVIVGFLDVGRARDIPDDLVFTGFSSGDPRVRLMLS